MLKPETRAGCNKVILSVLAQYLEEHPGLRFHQALVNLGLWTETDPFYIESKDALDYLVKENPIAQHYINNGLKIIGSTENEEPRDN